MKKRLGIALGGIVLLLIAWLAFDHYYYFSPGTDHSRIKQEAEKILQKEGPKLLKNNSLGMRPDMEKEMKWVQVLDIRELGSKSYLLFKLEYGLKGANMDRMIYEYGGGNGYILGLRQVEKKLGRLSLEKGMEFETNYLSASPVDCGLDADGIFYGYCKNPQVAKGSLETGDGKIVECEAKDRIFLAAVPGKNQDISPFFFNAQGEEMEPSYGFKVAFVSNDEKYYQQYTNSPMEWWNMSAKDIGAGSLPAGSMDAVWVFADQQQEALQGQTLKQLKELAEGGVPVIFIEMKDSNKLLRAFQVKEAPGKVAASEVEALYLGKDKSQELQVGFIVLDEDELSPILQKSINLRYQLDEDKQKGAGKKAAASKPTTGVKQGTTAVQGAPVQDVPIAPAPVGRVMP